MVVVAVCALPDHQQHQFDADQEQASDHTSIKWTRAHKMGADFLHGDLKAVPEDG